MTLSKQTKANRENAKQSIGPTTEHRIDYDLLIEDLRSELNPQSFFQEYLIKKIANCLWRTQRAAFAETAHINGQLNNLDEKIERELRCHSYKKKKITLFQKTNPFCCNSNIFMTLRRKSCFNKCG